MRWESGSALVLRWSEDEKANQGLRRVLLARAFRRGLTTRLALGLGLVTAIGFVTKLNYAGMLPGVLLGLGILGPFAGITGLAKGSLISQLNYVWQFYLPRIPGTVNDFPGLFRRISSGSTAMSAHTDGSTRHSLGGSTVLR
jgi:hypothetical protein